MRTLTFGDRTISYDTGLNCVDKTGDLGSSRFQRRVVDMEENIRSSPFSEADSGAGSDYSEDQEEDNKDAKDKRQLIKPDHMAMSQLLNFDEEEEDDLTDSDNTDDEEGDTVRNRCKWKKAIVKDLTNIDTKGKKLSRRHTISVCETSSRKVSLPPGPRVVQGAQEGGWWGQAGAQHASLPYQRVEREQTEMGDTASLATLNLNLEEVAHIRSVLTRAELEALPLEGDLKEDLEQGRMCFLCIATRFSLFNRGQKCQICKQNVCSKCFSRMRIPVEQFNAVPVQVLSPVPPVSPPPPSTPLASLCSTHLANCAGSAPNSPKAARKSPAVSQLNVSQLKDQLDRLPSAPPTYVATPLAPPPPVTGRWPQFSGASTLPGKKTARRWSVLVSARAGEREKLEGSLLAVCHDCKQMVLQVIRTQGISRRVRQRVRGQECSRL